MAYQNDLTEAEDRRCASCKALVELANICVTHDCNIEKPRQSWCKFYDSNSKPSGEPGGSAND